MNRHALATLSYNMLLLSIAAIIVYLASGLQQALMALSIGFAFASMVSLSELRLERKLEYASDLNDALFALHLVYMEMRYGGKSLYAGMEEAARGVHDRVGMNVYRIFDEMKGRLLMGQDLGQAVQSSCRGEGAAQAAWRAIGREYLKDFDAASSIKCVCDRLLREQALNKEKACGSLQKYLTMSMALSAVVPSFMVFVFVGYSMVYYSASILAIFSVMMLMVLPRAYALLRIHIAGTYAQ
jgi:hypothetical protein